MVGKLEKTKKKRRLEENGGRHALIQCIIKLHRYRHHSIESILSCRLLFIELRTTATHKIKTNELSVMQKERSFLIAKSHGEKTKQNQEKSNTHRIENLYT